MSFVNRENEMEVRKFVSPEFVIGKGALNLAGMYAKNFVSHKVLVVSDAGVIRAGWTDKVIRCLEEAKIPVALFGEVTPNPRSEEVMAGAEVYVKERCDVIVAVGGGSPMDCAKGIGIVSTNHKNILEHEGVDKIPRPGPPLICIPTTGGTSADISQFAIITDMARRVKISIISKMVVPDTSLIDPETTTTLSPYLTAATGMDAFSHAVEAYVSNASSPITDLHALDAIRLISHNLVETVKNPGNLHLRSNMMLGSLEAGLAFSNASLGTTHAMTHSLGGYLDLPHGELNAIVLPHVIGFNYDSASARYNRIAKMMGLEVTGKSPAAKKKALMNAVEKLRRDAGLNRTLGQIGMGKEDMPQLARNALNDSCIVTNPRTMTFEDVITIYGSAI